ncbi:MAG: LysE family translocator [Comamonadaceae bacterium]|nr:MAG: LysE family translocator [Comamonadaceae bacterium]
MTLSTYLLYVAAVALLVATPGPTMLMCMTNALNHGTRRAMTSVAGSVTAVLVVMSLSAMGLGALLAASETAFTTAKVIGAAYLIWLGIKTFRSDAPSLAVGSGNGGSSDSPSGDAAAGTRRRSFYLQGLLVGASNPKAVLFFAAFFPQFLNPAAPMAPQFAILALTFMALEFAVLTIGALSVSRLAPLLRKSGPVKWVNRVCGGLFTLMGGLLLLTRRSA